VPKPFEFISVPRLVFGSGESRRLGELAAGLGRTALVVFNGPNLGDRVAELLAAGGVTPVLHRQRGEPTVADVDAVLASARAAGCDLVIGAGGGSAIDAAKAVAGLLTNGGAVTDYMEVVGRGQKITKPAAPWIAVPTTAGTGAEATRNAVIGLPEKRFKASLRSELLVARVALIDAELGVDVPSDVTARCGMDALCQLIESYTSTGAGPLTDPLAVRGVELAAAALLPAFRDGQDRRAREAMAFAAYVSGVTLTNAGLGAVHGFAAPLGANYPVPHGTVCAALLPHVIAANLRAVEVDRTAATHLRPDTFSRYVLLGRVLSGDARMTGNEAAFACAHATARLVRDLAIPPLSTFGVREPDVPAMVALARKASSMRFNPVVLSDDALAAVLISAIRGADVG
jgi:alcohol dehydrogenase class IV